MVPSEASAEEGGSGPRFRAADGRPFAVSTKTGRSIFHNFGSEKSFSTFHFSSNYLNESHVLRLCSSKHQSSCATLSWAYVRFETAAGRTQFGQVQAHNQIRALENKVLRGLRNCGARSKVRTILEKRLRPRVFKAAPRVVAAVCIRPSSAHGTPRFTVPSKPRRKHSLSNVI
jgi:hypothetical protein